MWFSSLASSSKSTPGERKLFSFFLRSRIGNESVSLIFSESLFNNRWESHCLFRRVGVFIRCVSFFTLYKVTYLSIEGIHISTEPIHHTTEPIHHSTESIHHSTEPIHLTTEPIHHSTEPIHHSTEPIYLTTECIYLTTECVYHGFLLN